MSQLSDRGLRLGPLSSDDMRQVVAWRNGVRETLRTPYYLTEEMQREYYDRVITDRNGTTRYYKFSIDDKFIGYGGIENIIWENRAGEISILINPEFRNLGYGRQGVRKIFDTAFYYLNLEIVYGECYYCANINFWEKIINEFGCYVTTIPDRKYWGGEYYPSLYFSLTKTQFEASQNAV